MGKRSKQTLLQKRHASGQQKHEKCSATSITGQTQVKTKGLITSHKSGSKKEMLLFATTQLSTADVMLHQQARCAKANITEPHFQVGTKESHSR